MKSNKDFKEKLFLVNKANVNYIYSTNSIKYNLYDCKNVTWKTIAKVCNIIIESSHNNDLINYYYTCLPEHVRIFLNKKTQLDDNVFLNEIVNIIHFINCQLKKKQKAKRFYPITF